MDLKKPGARLFFFLLLVSLGLGFLPGRHDESAIPAAADGPGLSTPELISAAQARGDLDEESAALYLAYAFVDYQALPVAYRSPAPWSGTEPLRKLRQQRSLLAPGPAAEAIEQVLVGNCGGWNGFVPDHDILDTTHFHFQYAPVGDGLTINDYATALETSWAVQMDSFGWAAPPVLPSNPPPGNRYHVRVEPLPGGLLGFVTTDGTHAGLVGNNPATPWNEGDAYATCMVLNSSMGAGAPFRTLRSTAARELNLAIQYGYGALSGANAVDAAVSISGATWMEDEVFDGANANYSLLWPSFTACMGQYTAAAATYWLTWRGLTERYTSGVSGGAEQVMQDFWETVSQSAGASMLPALNTALANRGTSLADAYHAYAVAAKFSKTCGGGYAYPYCFREGLDYAAAAGPTAVHGTVAGVGSGFSGALADNYALNWVSLPLSGGPYDVTLRNTSGGGLLRGSLVCDTGAGLNVTSLPAVAGANAETTALNFNPSGCASAVAVLTNQLETSANPTSCTARSYQISVAAPSANLSGSSMTVAPPVATTGQTVTFSAWLANSGSLPAVASFVDTLPAALQPVGVPTSTSGPPPAVNGQTVTWSGNVAAGQTVILTFAAQLQVTATIVNTAQLDDGAGGLYTLTAFVNGDQVYLPTTVYR